MDVPLSSPALVGQSAGVRFVEAIPTGVGRMKYLVYIGLRYSRTDFVQSRLATSPTSANVGQRLKV